MRSTPILDGFVAQVRALRDGLEHWEMGADEVRGIVRAMMLGLHETLEQSALGQLRRTVLDFEQRILAFVDDLPLRDIADEIVAGALDRVAGAVDDVDVAGLLSPVTEFGDAVGSTISGLAGTAVRETVEGVWGSVEAALGEAAATLGQLHAALTAVTDQLGDFTSRVGPAVETLVTATTELRVTVEGFDLTQPAAAVLDNLHRARDTVAAIDVYCSADAVQLVHDAADALAGLDIAGTINGPIVAVLDAVDPGPPLHAAFAVLADVGTQLRAVDPPH